MDWSQQEFNSGRVRSCQFHTHVKEIHTLASPGTPMPGRWGPRGGAERPLFTAETQNQAPRLGPLGHSGSSLSSLEKSKLNSITVINFKPGSPVRARDFPFPLVRRIFFYLGLPSITLVASGKGTEMNILSPSRG